MVNGTTIVIDGVMNGYIVRLEDGERLAFHSLKKMKKVLWKHLERQAYGDEYSTSGPATFSSTVASSSYHPHGNFGEAQQIENQMEPSDFSFAGEPSGLFDATYLWIMQQVGGKGGCVNRAEQLQWYQEARQVRDLDDITIDLILKAEGIDINEAAVEDCKRAIIKYQYISDSNPWKWTTDHQLIESNIRIRLPPLPLF